MFDVSKLHLSDTPLAHISEIPWSDYTAADYTVEQWHAACLIHQHDGPPTSKGQCKLPVKTPNGAVNRNGVHAAAGALAGARGGVNASEEEKASAARALARLYEQLDEEPPASLVKHSDSDILEHFGVKGMHWGVRTSAPGTVKLNRFKRAKISENLRKESHIRLARERVAKQTELGRAGEKAFVALFGGETSNSMAKTSIQSLHNQNSRIRKGEMTLLDKLSVYGGTATIDLIAPTVSKSGKPKERR